MIGNRNLVHTGERRPDSGATERLKVSQGVEAVGASTASQMSSSCVFRPSKTLDAFYMSMFRVLNCL